MSYIGKYSLKNIIYIYLINGSGTLAQTHVEEEDPSAYIYKKITSRWIWDSNGKPSKLRVLEECKVQTHKDIGIGKGFLGFLNNTPKP